MSDFICRCPSRDLFWHGCRCNSNLRKRTIPANLLVAELGLTRSWDVVKRHTVYLPNFGRHLNEPACIEDVILNLWQIESDSQDLYEEIVRSLEAEFDFIRRYSLR